MAERKGKAVCSVVAPLFKSRRSLLSLSLLIFNISLQEEGSDSAWAVVAGQLLGREPVHRPGELGVLPDTHHVGAAVGGGEGVLC